MSRVQRIPPAVAWRASCGFAAAIVICCGCSGSNPQPPAATSSSGEIGANDDNSRTDVDRVSGIVTATESQAAAALEALGPDEETRRRIIRQNDDGHVVAVDLTDIVAGDRELISLRQLPHLRRLALAGTSDDALRHLAELSQLRDLKLRGPQITDAGLNWLRRLTGLKVISLQEATISDAGLSILSEFPNLQNLTLFRMSISSAGLEPIGRIEGLRRLNLRGSTVDNEGMQHLQSLSALRILDVSESRVGNEGLEFLKNLPKLESLNLWATRVGDGGMQHVAQMRSLTRLNLDNVGNTSENIALTDAGVRHLAQLEHLAWIHLGKTQVGDQSLTVLAGLPKLKDLIVTNCPNVTAAGIHRLQETRPDLRIER